MLDKTREFATLYGGTGPTRFTQDGNRYGANEKYLGKVDATPALNETNLGGDDTIAKDFSIMDKPELIALATSHGLHANGRMSEETLRNKLSSHNADILRDSAEDTPSV